jgi:hypothetical protein
LSGDREFLFEVRRATLRVYVEQTSGWDEAEQRAIADKEFGELPYAVVEESGRPVGYVCVIHEREYDFEDPRTAMEWSPTGSRGDATCSVDFLS